MAGPEVGGAPLVFAKSDTESPDAVDQPWSASVRDMPEEMGELDLKFSTEVRCQCTWTNPPTPVPTPSPTPPTPAPDYGLAPAPTPAPLVAPTADTQVMPDLMPPPPAPLASSLTTAALTANQTVMDLGNNTIELVLVKEEAGGGAALSANATRNATAVPANTTAAPSPLPTAVPTPGTTAFVFLDAANESSGSGIPNLPTTPPPSPAPLCAKGRFRPCMLAHNCTPHSPCADCPAGRFTDRLQSIWCNDCPAGRFQLQHAATACTRCSSCPAGQSRHQCSGSSAGHCHACPTGRYTRGQTAQALCSVCTACPAGQQRRGCGGRTVSPCHACPKNAFNLGGGAWNSSCAPCAACPYRATRSGCGGASAGDCTLPPDGPNSLAPTSHPSPAPTYAPSPAPSPGPTPPTPPPPPPVAVLGGTEEAFALLGMQRARTVPLPPRPSPSPSPPPPPLQQRLLASKAFRIATGCTAASLLLLGALYQAAGRHTKLVLARLVPSAQGQQQFAGYQVVMEHDETEGVGMLLQHHQQGEVPTEKPPAV